MSRRRKLKRGKTIKVIPDYVNNVEFNFEEIKNECEKYGFECFFKAEGKVLEVKSKYDNWIIPVDNTKRIIKLYHDVKGSKTHLQNIFFDCKFLLNSTCSHDFYKSKRRGGNIVDDVMYRSTHGKIPRFKVN